MMMDIVANTQKLGFLPAFTGGGAVDNDMKFNNQFRSLSAGKRRKLVKDALEKEKDALEKEINALIRVYDADIKPQVNVNADVIQAALTLLQMRHTSTKEAGVHIPTRKRSVANKRRKRQISEKFPEIAPKRIARSERGGDAEKYIKSAPEPAMREIMQATVQQGMGGTNITWLDKKPITQSDLRRDQNRLYLPNQVDKILTDEEKRLVRQKTLPVAVVDYRGQTLDTTLKYWSSVGRYVFIKNWCQFAEDHHVKAGDAYELWSFRAPSQQGQEGSPEGLCFALNFPELPRL